MIPNCDCCHEPMTEVAKKKHFKKKSDGTVGKEFYYIRHFNCPLCDITVSQWPEHDKWAAPLAVRAAKIENELQAREPFENN